MALTAKEKMRRYRERLKKQNPEKYEEQRKKNLERIKSKKKKISEMEPAEAEAKREEWKKEKRRNRQRHYDLNRVVAPVAMCKNVDNNVTSVNVEDSSAKKMKSKIKLLSKQIRNLNANNEKLKTRIERYKKRIQRLQLQASKSIASLQRTLDIVKARNEVLECALKTSFTNCTKTSEKRVIKRVVQNSKNKQYTSKVLGLKATVRQRTKKVKKIKIQEITDFYVRDDVSRTTAGKKECRVKNKDKKQIRYLVDTIINLHKKYRSEGGRFGLTTFYKGRPFYVLTPHNQSRRTCLCVKHDNIKFQYETLKKYQIVSTSFDVLMQKLVCDTKKFDCMYNICNKCKNNTPEFTAEQDILTKIVNWYKWERQDHVYTNKSGTTVRTKKTARDKKTNTVQKLMDDFSRDITVFKKHFYNNIHQQKEYQKAIINLKDNEAVIVCDFSENFDCKLSQEIQSMHFGASKSQISLHTGMIYFKNEAQSFCTMSENLNHQPPAIWAHLTPILDTVKQKCPHVDVIHFYSDGPSSQYRQKHNFFLHSLFTTDLKLSYSTWSYFEAGHGKSVADGIGGTIKRMLDSKVCHGTDIQDARDAYEALKQSKTVINVHLIEDEAIKEILMRIPDNIPTLSGTMKIHQIIACDGIKIMYRDISCFCEPLRGNCSCFSPRQHTLLSSNSCTNMNNIVDVPSNRKIQGDLPTLSTCETVKTDLKKVLKESCCTELNNDLNDTDFLEDLSPLPSYQVNNTPVKSFVDSREETTLYDAIDMEGINDYASCSTSMLHFESQNFDINSVPFIILPEKVPISPKTRSVEKNDTLNSMPCTSMKFTKNKAIHTYKTFKFQNCNKCSCSILGRSAKCMACKLFYCEDCVGVGNPSFFDYLCDICLQGSDED